MRIDMHCHVVGNGENIDEVDRDVYFYPDDNQHWFARILYTAVENDLEGMGGDQDRDGKISADEYFALVCRLLSTSEEIDGIVLLALDACYSPKTGLLNERETDLWVSNRLLARKVDELNERLPQDGSSRRFFFGASVSPNREDWESALEWVLRHTSAALVKWIPSVQHIHLMDERHNDFYDALAAAKMPLLCHVGPEYAFPEGIENKRLDNFRHLERAIERGVTVIAAHCATPVFPLIDKNEMREFHAFMKDANSDGTVRLWADTSALSLATRIPLLPEVLDLFPASWLVHGSDFPIPIDGWTHLPYVTHDVTLSEYLRICRTKNPLDRDVRIKDAVGFPDSILGNAEKVLRLCDARP